MPENERGDADVMGVVPLLFPASSWTLGSSSFSLKGWDSASYAFLFLGEEQPQELVKSKGISPPPSEGLDVSRRH